jgi:hypothetical protein
MSATPLETGCAVASIIREQPLVPAAYGIVLFIYDADNQHFVWRPKWHRIADISEISDLA